MHNSFTETEKQMPSMLQLVHIRNNEWMVWDNFNNKEAYVGTQDQCEQFMDDIRGEMSW